MSKISPKKIATALLCLLPRPFSSIGLNMIGHKISYEAKIGWSLIFVEHLTLEAGSKIRHLNFLQCEKIVLSQKSEIQRGNVIYGPVNIVLSNSAVVGNGNKITRAFAEGDSSATQLSLGSLSKITSTHRIDLTRSVSFGPHSTLAGAGSQMWTHGYVHEATGSGRYRVDGTVTVGSNVYLGSGVIITAGLSIGDGVQVGAGATVTTSLEGEDVMFVSQPLRSIDISGGRSKRIDLDLDENVTVETVYLKKQDE